MPAVQQADEAGIPVVAIDAILPEGPQKGADSASINAAAGADMAAYFVDYVASDMGGQPSSESSVP
jgi:ribose transport system substrate-binding protein